MAQFDIYHNLNKSNKKEVPYLLDIQHTILDNLSTKVVIPLAINEIEKKIIDPEFIVDNTKVVMLTTQIAAVPQAMLGMKVCSFKDKRAEIINAIDFLVTGF